MQGKSSLLLNYNEKYKEDNKITRKYDDEVVFENYYTSLPITLAKILRILSLEYLSDQGRLFISSFRNSVIDSHPAAPNLGKIYSEI